MLVFFKAIGALTSKPYSFTSRSWELKSISSIDILDSICSNIRIDIRGTNIMRILPRINENLNEEWISDKIRFSYDSLKLLRLYFVGFFFNNSFIYLSWKEFFKIFKDLFLIINKFNYKFINFMGSTGSLLDNESIIFFKDFCNSLGTSNLNNKSYYFRDFRSTFRLSKTLKELNTADLILFLGLNVRLELPLLNTHIRTYYLLHNLLVGSLSFSSKFNFFVKHIGNSYLDLINLVSGKDWFSLQLLSSKNSLIFLSGHLLKLYLGFFFFNICIILEKLLNICVNIVYTNVGDINCCELNFGLGKNQIQSKEEYTQYYKYNLFTLHYNLENIIKFNKNSFNIFQGHHGFEDLDADIVLPSVTFFEKNSTYLNLEGRVQLTKSNVKNLGISKNNWLILIALACCLNQVTEYFHILLKFLSQKFNFKNLNLNFIRKRLYCISPCFHLKFLNKVYYNIFYLYSRNIFKTSFFNHIFFTLFNNFYKNDLLSNASSTMSLCIKYFINKLNNF